MNFRRDVVVTRQKSWRDNLNYVAYQRSALADALDELGTGFLGVELNPNSSLDPDYVRDCATVFN